MLGYKLQKFNNMDYDFKCLDCKTMLYILDLEPEHDEPNAEHECCPNCGSKKLKDLND